MVIVELGGARNSKAQAPSLPLHEHEFRSSALFRSDHSCVSVSMRGPTRGREFSPEGVIWPQDHSRIEPSTCRCAINS